MVDDALASTGRLHPYRAQVRLAIRITTASLISYFLGLLLGLQNSHWAVLTSIIVMQASVGASLKAMFDRLVGSLGGAVVGVIVSVALHYTGVSSPATALVVGLPPLALLAALKPAYRVTPVTFVILMLTPDLQQLGPVAAAVHRMFEIALGSVVALAVSLLVLPARAHDALVHAVAQALNGMADLMAALPGGLTGEVDAAALAAAHARIRAAIGKAEAAADEALREGASHLTGGPDPLPVCRTLRRLHHDLASLGRTVAVPLPDPVGAGLNPPLVGLADAISRFFASSAAAFARLEPLPPLAELDPSFARQSSAVSEIRRRGTGRSLSDDDVTRIFGLGFALDQLRRNLEDLDDRAAELARQPRER